MRNVHDNVLSCVGDTPIVRLNSVTEGLKANIFAKLEMLNPGGSIKDRIALQIVDDAEAAGELEVGQTIVEGTSGNTGAGLAMVGAVRGYRTTFVMPDKQSEEKRAALRAYGARVVVTPTAVEPEDPRSYYSVSDRLGHEDGAFFANQYHNPSNPKAHYLMTGPEIWEQMDGKVDVVVCGLGTGGTISGIGQFLKEKNPEVRIVGVDPVGSLYYDYFHTGQLTPAFTYVVEGIGEDFMPSTIDWQYIDDVVRVNDKECMQMTRRVVREEGIFCGGSCGAAVAGALKWVRLHDAEDLNVLIILPDSGSRYLSKIFNDLWMKENGFLEPDSSLGTVRELLEHKGKRGVISVSPDATVSEVIGTMKLHGISQVPVLDDGRLAGILSETRLLERALQGTPGKTRVRELVQANYTTVDRDTELSTLSELFRRFKVAFVIEGQKPIDVITKIDLIDHIATSRGEL
ncbi:MAG: pyridoxal-phosphate dependent enzyme [Alphaproteobacteria bacterium]|nr:pyridoxal-phosphate dependent enzyme [Alphaproteobacteria bacterium]MCB9791495.1 pyridoxal-phosphate dependent enzyme [Alphaproteobacteria bacterium]